MITPLIAVITPTKNRRALLADTMDSVQQQTLQAWEHIIVDDGSDDGTADYVSRRAAADPRVRYLPRAGITAGANVCRNQGLAAATADLIVFLDSDDVLRTFCLANRIEVMRRNADLDFAVFRAGVFCETLGDLNRLYHPQAPQDELLAFLSLECPWQTSGPIWRREFIQKIGGFDETLSSMQDLELHVRALSARGKYVHFSDIDHDIRWQNDASKTSVRHFNDPRFIEAAERVQYKLLETLRNSGLLNWSRQRAVAGLCFGTAESLLRTGRPAHAFRIWLSGSRRQRTPGRLRLMGLCMLCIGLLGADPACWNQRFINKWKGWMRFRQEPALMPSELQPTTKAH